MRKNQKLFLSSSPEEFGTICTCVETPRKKSVKKGKILYAEAEVRITDCYKPINLEFDFDSKEKYLKRKEKLKNMIKALKQFEKEMDMGFKDFQELQEYQKEMKEN